MASLSSPMPQQEAKSPWHSPVPYLFGGLAAMLGLIAFALLILACSYWKLSGYLDNEDLESGKEDEDTEKQERQVEYEEKILVIMAGDVKPTFLATPVSSTNSDRTCSSTTFTKPQKLDHHVTSDSDHVH